MTRRRNVIVAGRYIELLAQSNEYDPYNYVGRQFHDDLVRRLSTPTKNDTPDTRSHNSESRLI